MSYLSRIIDESNGADSIALKSLERGLKDVIKESEKASNALLSALLYEDLTEDLTQAWPLAAHLVDEQPEDVDGGGGREHLSLGDVASSDEDIAPATGVAA